jgi:hypothetical protein
MVRIPLERFQRPRTEGSSHPERTHDPLKLARYYQSQLDSASSRTVPHSPVSSARRAATRVKAGNAFYLKKGQVT